MRTKTLLAAAVAVLAPAALTSDQAVAQPSCAMVQSIDSWADIDESTVTLETSPRGRYKVVFTAPCPDARRATLVLIRRPPTQGACLLPGDSIVFARESSAGPQYYDYDEACVIKTIAPLPASAIEDSPRGQK